MTINILVMTTKTKLFNRISIIKPQINCLNIVI